MRTKNQTHILLVDDEPITLNTLSYGLESLGYKVTSYEKPEDALEQFQEDAVDLAIFDYSMPKMNGLELAARVIDIRHIPIVMLSAHNDLPIVKDAIGAGVSGYLVKPVEAEKLAPSIEAALARFTELSALLDQGKNIQAGVESHRMISTAVGILMAKTSLSQDEAFQKLRRLARNKRRPLKDLAFDLVDKISTANDIISDAEKIPE